jgi:uncharacterized protein YoxC
MAKDVQFGVTADDKSAKGLASVEQNFKRAQKSIKADSDKTIQQWTDRIVKATNLIGPQMAGTLAKGFATAGQAGAPLLVGGVVAAAPLIAGTIAGAIIGGAGIGGVVGGVLVASKDARVQSAWQDLSKDVGDRLEQAGGQFVAPTLQGVAEVRKAVDSIDIDQIFADSAAFVVPLAEGASRAITALGDGLEDLVHNAGPVINSIADGIGDVGEAVGEGLSSLSDNADSAAASLDTVFTTMSKLTKTTFDVVNGLIEVDEWMRKNGIQGSIVIDTINQLTGSSDNFTKHTKGAADAGNTLNNALLEGVEPGNQYAAAVAESAKASQDLDSANRSLYGSQTQAAQAMADATKIIKKNGDTLELNSQKGRDNRAALESVAGALASNYQNYVKVNGVGAQSEVIAKKNRDAFVGLASKAGLSAGAARQLASDLGLLPAKKQTDIVANTHDAEARLKAVQARIAAIRSKQVTIEVQTRYPQSRDNADKLRFDAGAHFAAVRADSAVARTGGPAPINVSPVVENRINMNLDGRPFRSMVTQSQERAAWRAKVGNR